MHAWFFYLTWQEEGWVVCRVFKKKHHQRGIPSDAIIDEHEDQLNHSMASNLDRKHNHFQMPPCDFSCDNSMHIPQLLSMESSALAFTPPSLNLNAIDLECSQNLMKLTSAGGGGGGGGSGGGGTFLPQAGGDWLILDQQFHNKRNPTTSQVADVGNGVQKCQFQYLGCDSHDPLKFSK